MITKYHYINFLDVDELERSYCYEFGRKMTHRGYSYSTEGTIDLSIVPPYQEDGCYFNLYYNGTVLADTFIISKEKIFKSYFNRWTISLAYPSSYFNRDQYKIQTNNIKGIHCLNRYK